MISSMRGGGSEQQTLLLLRHLDRSLLTPHLYLTEKTGGLMARVPDDVTIHCFGDADTRGGLYFPGRVMRRQWAPRSRGFRPLPRPATRP